MIIKNKFVNLKQIAESGQAFRWYPINNGYVVVANSDAVVMRQLESGISIESEDQIWLHYLDMNRNYGAITELYCQKDEYLKKAVEYGSGIRILNQDPFEIIMTFIISANNNIKRITNAVLELSKRYGKFLKEIEGIEYYAFPSPDALREVPIEAYRACGVGYRDKYLYSFVQDVINHNIDLEGIRTLNDSELMVELLRLKGVGEKVANCILLFGYGRVERFPIDTWIRKILIEAYGIDENCMKEFAEDYFKPYGGIAQQYLFYYGRMK